jgi:vancomycin resistance protein YoaR
MGTQSNQRPRRQDSRDTARHLAIVKARNKRIMILSVSACLILILLATAITGVVMLARNRQVDDKILENVIVGGINIGGMTKEEAANAISLSIEPKLTSQSMIVRLDNDTLELTPELTGILLDVEDLVDAAFAYGRTGTRLEQNMARLQAQSKTHTIALLPYLRLNLSKIRSAVEDFCADYSVEMVDPVVQVEGMQPHYVVGGDNSNAVHQTLIITMGSPESNLDANDLYYAILDAYSLLQMEVRYAVPVVIEPEKPSAQAIFDMYCTAPVDALIDPKTFEVTPEVYGYGFNIYALQRLIDRAEYGQRLELTMEFLLPDITAEALAGDLFQDLLVSYTATSTSTTANRNKNLATACATLNGWVIKAGETFDLNEVLGPRTAERGYVSAPVYTGSTSNIVGGGVNQAASALYYCALRAGLQINEHQFHRYAMTYTPMGTDAALSNSENLTFTNTTSAPIRILAEPIGGNVKITFMGTEEKEYLLDIESTITAEMAPAIVYQSMQKDNVYGYKDGNIIQTGLTGYTVEVYLCKYDPTTGALVSRELLHTVTYEKRDIIIIKIEGAE